MKFLICTDCGWWWDLEIEPEDFVVCCADCGGKSLTDIDDTPEQLAARVLNIRNRKA